MMDGYHFFVHIKLFFSKRQEGIGIIETKQGGDNDNPNASIYIYEHSHLHDYYTQNIY